MKAISLFCFLVMSFILVATSAWADVFVISNASGVAAADIKDIFLGEKQFAGALKLDPVDNAAAQAQFASKALQMDVAKYNSAWAKKAFRDGINPPAVKGSDLEVIQYIKANPGAVGYVISSPPADVKVITKY